jgi:hypothetical protein
MTIKTNFFNTNNKKIESEKRKENITSKMDWIHLHVKRCWHCWPSLILGLHKQQSNMCNNTQNEGRHLEVRLFNIHFDSTWTSPLIIIKINCVIPILNLTSTDLLMVTFVTNFTFSKMSLMQILNFKPHLLILAYIKQETIPNRGIKLVVLLHHL